MEIHRQRCQSCQSIDLRNILKREQGKPAVVLVRCQRCGALVARYALADYYHHGKGLESWIRGMGGTVLESGRVTLARFEQVKQTAVEEYEAALEQLKHDGKDV